MVRQSEQETPEGYQCQLEIEMLRGLFWIQCHRRGRRLDQFHQEDCGGQRLTSQLEKNLRPD